jgi:hypothetical protein
MSTPFQTVGTLLLPGAPGLPQDPIPFGFTGQYDHKAEYELVLSGSGTKNVSFGTLSAAGPKLFLLVYEADAVPAGSPAQPPITVALNSGAALEVSPGGFLALGSPSPTTGLASVQVAHTGAGRVRVWLLG